MIRCHGCSQYQICTTRRVRFVDVAPSTRAVHVHVTLHVPSTSKTLHVQTSSLSSRSPPPRILLKPVFAALHMYEPLDIRVIEAGLSIFSDQTLKKPLFASSRTRTTTAASAAGLAVLAAWNT